MKEESNHKVKMIRLHNSPKLSLAMLQSLKGIPGRKELGKRGRLWRYPGPTVTGSPTYFSCGLSKALPLSGILSSSVNWREQCPLGRLFVIRNMSINYLAHTS